MLLRMVVVLGAVCALAYGLLRFGLRRFVHSSGEQARRLEVIERVGVAPKQSLLVVRAGRKFWLIGSSEAGLSALGRLEEADWAVAEGQGTDEHYLIERGENEGGAILDDPAYDGAPFGGDELLNNGGK